MEQREEKITLKMPARFKNGSVAFHHFTKLKQQVEALRPIIGADYIMLEQAADLYALCRSLLIDLEKTGNYLGQGDDMRKNPLVSDYKSIQASYSAMLRDLGLTIKDRTPSPVGGNSSKLSEFFS